jgi:hypothetical protein
MATHKSNTKCWSHCFLQCLCSVAVGALADTMQVWEDCEGAGRRLQKVDMAAITTALDRAAAAAWQTVMVGCNPRDIPDAQHVGVKLGA